LRGRVEAVDDRPKAAARKRTAGSKPDIHHRAMQAPTCRWRRSNRLHAHADSSVGSSRRERKKRIEVGGRHGLLPGGGAITVAGHDADVEKSSRSFAQIGWCDAKSGG